MHVSDDEEEEMRRLRAQLAHNRAAFGLAAPLASSPHHQQPQRRLPSDTAILRSPPARYHDAMGDVSARTMPAPLAATDADYYTLSGAVSAFAPDDAVPRLGRTYGYSSGRRSDHQCLVPSGPAHVPVPASLPTTSPQRRRGPLVSIFPQPSSSAEFTGVPVLGPIAMLRGCAREYPTLSPRHRLDTRSIDIPRQPFPALTSSFESTTTPRAACLVSPTRRRSNRGGGSGLQSPRDDNDDSQWRPPAVLHHGGVCPIIETPPRRGPPSPSQHHSAAKLVPLVSPPTVVGPRASDEPTHTTAATMRDAITALRSDVAAGLAARRHAAATVTGAEEAATPSSLTPLSELRTQHDDRQERVHVSGKSHARTGATSSNSGGSGIAAAPGPSRQSASRLSSRRQSLTTEDKGDPLHALRRQVAESDGQEIFSDGGVGTPLTRGRRPTLLPRTGARYVVSDSSGPESTGPSPAASLRPPAPAPETRHRADAATTFNLTTTTTSGTEGAGRRHDADATDADVLASTLRPRVPPPGVFGDGWITSEPPQQPKRTSSTGCDDFGTEGATSDAHAADGRAGDVSAGTVSPFASRRPSAASSVGPAVCAFLSGARAGGDAGSTFGASTGAGGTVVNLHPSRHTNLWHRQVDVDPRPHRVAQDVAATGPQRTVVSTTRSAFAFGAAAGLGLSQGGHPGRSSPLHGRTTVQVVTSTKRVVTYSV